MTNTDVLPMQAALSGNVEVALAVVSRLNDGEPRADFALRMVSAAEANPNPNIKEAAWAVFKIAWGSREAHYEIQRARAFEPVSIADIFATLAPAQDAAPGSVTLYRGLRVPDDQPPFIPWWRGVSWTTDLSTAAFFATRYWMNAGSPAVVEITISRAQIAWADEGREFEAIPDSYIMELLDEPEAAAEEIGLKIEGRANLDLSAITDDDRSRWAAFAERQS